ncbi:MAG: hypothetical protein K2K55_09570 [Duncaniella sp.]|nr:hypothetical protein [Duncaniella sp.]
MKITDLDIKIQKTLLAMAVAIAAMLLPAPLEAQITSPYSRYGYGILGDNASSAQNQMGGTGYAMRSGRQINAMNPASYSACDSMTFIFDMGFDLLYYDREDAGGRDSDWGGSLQYITMQVPIKKWIGMSAGLVPYSRVGYSFGSDISNGVATHKGTGGINNLYLGIGLEPIKNLSIGANVGYLFGNIVNDVYATQSGGTAAIFEQMMEVRDYSLLFGAQYAIQWNRVDRIVLGVTYAPKKSFLGKTYITKYLQTTSTTTVPEVIAPGEVKLKNNFEQAETWGAGIAYDRGDRIHVEADFTFQPWSKAKYTQLENFTSTHLADRWKIGVGGSIIPSLRGSYLKRIAYRLGAFYNRDYMVVRDNNHVRDWGVTAGFGFPALRSKTVINLGLEYHNRQATPVALLKENYFQINLGVNFNAVWFFQSKLR